MSTIEVVCDRHGGLPWLLARFTCSPAGRWAEQWLAQVGDGPVPGHGGGVRRTRAGLAIACAHHGEQAFRMARLRLVLDELAAAGRDTVPVAELQLRCSRPANR